MAIGPFSTGTLLPIWSIVVLQTNNSVYNLTGATFTGTLKSVSGSSIKTLTAGAFAIVVAADGSLSYTPVAADVDTAGDWILEVVITISAKPVNVQVCGPDSREPAIRMWPRKNS